MTQTRPSAEDLRGGDVHRVGLDADIAARLRQAILRGVFSPGDRLVELELASRWDVSQATVRAALKILQHEGLVESRPRRGSFVRTLSEADVLEIYSLRDALEALAARHAAKRIDDRGRSSIVKILDGMRSAVESGNRKRMLDLDFEFHRQIVGLSGHSRLADIYAGLEMQTRLFLTLTDQFHHDLEELVAIHEPLARAVMEGDEGQAFGLASSHSQGDGRKLTEAIACARQISTQE